MHDLKQTWQDLFFGFRIALDVRKMSLAFAVLAALAVIGAIAMWILLEDTASHLQEQHQQAYAGELQEYVNVFGDAPLPASQTQPGPADDANIDIGIWEARVTELGGSPDLLRGLAQDRLPVQVGEDPSTLGLLRSGQRQAFSDLVAFTLADMGLRDWRWTGEYEARGLTGLRLLVIALAVLLFWALASGWIGSISRIAAVELARDERMELTRATGYAKQKRRSFFWSPLTILAIIVVLYLCIALWGVVGRIPVAGPILTAITSPLVLFAGFLMALVAIGGVFGFPLLSPAVGTEGSDSFDAVSRSFSYVYSRPWHYLWYLLVSGVYGIVSIGFIWIFTLLTFYFASIPARWAMGADFQNFLAFIGHLPRTLMHACGYEGGASALGDWLYLSVFGGKYLPESGVMTFGELGTQGGFFLQVFTVIVGFIVYFIAGLALSYALSYLLTQFTVIYFLLRHQVDGSDLSEIYFEVDMDPWAPLPEDLPKPVTEDTPTDASDVPAAEKNVENTGEDNDVSGAAEKKTDTSSSDSTESPGE